MMHLKKRDVACWFVAKTHGMIGIQHSLERWCLGCITDLWQQVFSRLWKNCTGQDPLW